MNLQVSAPEINKTPLQRLRPDYIVNAPRYTSYPTANHFTDKFQASDYLSSIEGSNGRNSSPLSLYFHIPFCEHLCFYCGCSKILTRKRDKAAIYLEALFKEIEMTGKLFDNDREVMQLHLGGGTPTFMTPLQLDSLVNFVARHFRFNQKDEERDFSIEIDPRTTSAESIGELRKSGFNRISLGVQDFDQKVQKAIHRVQPRELTTSVVKAARQCGFKSINVDLIYGLPFQTPESFSRTISDIIELAPDRISLFNYAHMPDMFPAQRRINASDLPADADRLAMFAQSAESLEQAGYDHIGLDHFARQDDELAQAKANGTIHRNFQGYTTHGHCDLIGMGVTSISKVGNCYSQNTKDLEVYYRQLEGNQLPCCRGITLNHEDEVRRYVIEQLMCTGQVQFRNLQRRFSVDFLTHFSSELRGVLSQYVEDLLVDIDTGRMLILPKGKPLVRVICTAFDTYRTDSSSQRHSKAI